MSHVLECVNKHLKTPTVDSLADVGAYSVCSKISHLLKESEETSKEETKPAAKEEAKMVAKEAVKEPIQQSGSDPIQEPLDLQSRYGKGSWALVTGAGQGIGESWAKELAKKNFNLVLVDLQDKVHNLASSLKDTYKIEVKSLALDVSSDGTVEQIMDSLKGLDISILINNVGIIWIGEFSKQTKEEIKRLMKINVESVIELSRNILPLMMNRNLRSAIVFMSSISGVQGAPYFSIYSATKAFLRFFALSLSGEIKSKVDVLSVEPILVSTGMTNFLDPSERVSTSDDTVQEALSVLGRELETIGSRKHQAIYERSIKMDQATIVDINARRFRKMFGIDNN